MLSLLVSILIFALVIWLVLWVISILPIPAPFNRVAQAVVGVVALIWLLEMLLGSGGIGRISV